MNSYKSNKFSMIQELDNFLQGSIPAFAEPFSLGIFFNIEFLNLKDIQFSQDIITSAGKKINSDSFNLLSKEEINFIKHIERETTFTHEIKHYHDMLFSVYGIWKSTYNFEKLLNLYELIYFNKEYNNGNLKLNFSILDSDLKDIYNDKFFNINKLIEKGRFANIMSHSSVFNVEEIMEALAVCAQLQEIYNVYGELSSDAYLKLKLRQNNKYSKVLSCFDQIFDNLDFESIFYILMCSINGDIQMELNSAFPGNRLLDILTFINYEKGIKNLNNINIKELMNEYFFIRNYNTPIDSIKKNINMHKSSIERIKNKFKNEKLNNIYRFKHKYHIKNVFEILDEVTELREKLLLHIQNNEDMIFSLKTYIDSFELLPEPHILYYSKINDTKNLITSVDIDSRFYEDFNIIQEKEGVPLLFSRKKTLKENSIRLSDSWLKLLDEIFLLYTFVEGLDINCAPDIFKLFNMRIMASNYEFIK
ncbi:hypothetical protein ACN09X_04480 [Aliarcobacter butzleri]|uniref:hypothetical protein n=1 Tax=Aliarcobacter butzleri TaxID=28197 RepID=UPI003AE6C64E